MLISNADIVMLVTYVLYFELLMRVLFLFCIVFGFFHTPLTNFSLLPLPPLSKRCNQVGGVRMAHPPWTPYHVYCRFQPDQRHRVRDQAIGRCYDQKHAGMCVYVYVWVCVYVYIYAWIFWVRWLDLACMLVRA
jgi:hypothetical protein